MVFVDCGAHDGSILSRVKKTRGFTECYAFECNPYYKGRDYGPGVTPIYKAVWIADDTIPLYVNHKRPRIQGHSLIKGKTTGALDFEHPVYVPSIDFSSWVLSTFHSGERLCVKMNIEGAEYAVLERCIRQGAAESIEELHVQFHEHKCHIHADVHNGLLDSLRSVPGLKLFQGYGRLYHG